MRYKPIFVSRCAFFRVDGQYLNYDVAVARLSTDISGLCKAITESQKEVQGQYSAVSNFLNEY